jgi:hypothetical protein
MSIAIPPSAWRLQPGQQAFVRGWPQGETVLILAQLEFIDWPHYIVADSNGAEWRISQLQLSSRPIPADR